MTGSSSSVVGRLLVFGSALGVLVAGCASDDSDASVVPSTNSTSTASTDVSDPTGVAEARGSLTLTYDIVGPDGSLDQAIVDVRERAAAIGVDAVVSVFAAGLEVIVTDVRRADVVQLERSFDALGATVQIRPVLSQCQTVALQPSESSMPSTTVFQFPHQESDPTTAQILPVAGAEPIQACQVGPSLATGAIFDANAVVQDDPAYGLVVVAGLRPGAAGADAWNAAAAACYDRASTCPTQQLALELDGELQSVATVQTPVFEGTIQISGAFDAHGAAALADTLNRGSRDYSLMSTGSEFAE